MESQIEHRMLAGVLGQAAELHRIEPEARRLAVAGRRVFGEMLGELTGLEVIFFDERLTTSAAHQIMNLTDTRGSKRKGKVDTLSAEIILQDYLDSQKNR